MIKTLCLCVDAMLEVVDKLSRPYSVDSVVLSLPKRIAEAILYMQDNLNTFNNKVSAALYTCLKKRPNGVVHVIILSWITHSHVILSSVRSLENKSRYVWWNPRADFNR